MSIISDAVDAIQNWFNGVLADGIVSSLQNTCNTLSTTFNSSSNVGLFKTFLKDTPNTFTGTTDGSGTAVWSGIETITNNAIVPIGMFILVVVLLNDLIQTVISGNNFRDFDTSIFIKWVIKAFCGILLVSNVFYIATGLFGLGTSAINAGISTVFPNSGNFLGNTTFDPATLKSNLTQYLSTGDLIIVLIFSFLTSIITFIVLGVIIVVLANRIIEVFMYLSIAPIPIATIMNNDWGQIGKNWLRNILALAFQGFFIIIALSIFKVLLSNVIKTLNTIGTAGTSSATITSSMALMFGFIVALIFTILRSGNISKSVFSAH